MVIISKAGVGDYKIVRGSSRLRSDSWPSRIPTPTTAERRHPQLNMICELEPNTESVHYNAYNLAAVDVVRIEWSTGSAPCDCPHRQGLAGLVGNQGYTGRVQQDASKNQQGSEPKRTEKDFGQQHRESSAR